MDTRGKTIKAVADICFLAYEDAKTKQAVREDENPQVPSRLVETREVYEGHEECVVTRYRP